MILKLHCKRCNKKVPIKSIKELKLFKYYHSLCNLCLSELYNEYYKDS